MWAGLVNSSIDTGDSFLLILWVQKVHRRDDAEWASVWTLTGTRKNAAVDPTFQQRPLWPPHRGVKVSEDLLKHSGPAVYHFSKFFCKCVSQIHVRSLTFVHSKHRTLNVFLPLQFTLLTRVNFGTLLLWQILKCVKKRRSVKYCLEWGVLCVINSAQTSSMALKFNTQHKKNTFLVHFSVMSHK